MAIGVAAAAESMWVWIPMVVLIVAIVTLSTIDVLTYRLPDRIVFTSLLISFPAIAAAALAMGRPGAVGQAVAGMIAYFLLLLVAHLISPAGLGFGDVKFALLLGLHLGWVAGSQHSGLAPVIRVVLYALVVGCALGVVSGLVSAVVHTLRGRVGAVSLSARSFPFGPALGAGTLIVIFFGDAI